MASGSTLTLHFMWLKEQSSSHLLPAERLSSEPVLMASESRVLTPGSTASGFVSWVLLGGDCVSYIQVSAISTRLIKHFRFSCPMRSSPHCKSFAYSQYPLGHI